MEELLQKQKALKARLKEMGSVAVAFSGGTDSAFLLKTAHDVLGRRALAVTAGSPLFPFNEKYAVELFCETEKIEHIYIFFDLLSEPGIAQNPPDRCYRCKRKMFRELLDTAEEEGVKFLLEGSNADDREEDRPGMRALRELGVRSPLQEVGLTKAEIRLLSKKLGLPTWDKPSATCLATRFPYGETLTCEKLEAVDNAERFIADLGFRRVRVRVHGNIARIETDPAEFSVMLRPDTASEINAFLRKLGFSYVTMDLGGYQTGSMEGKM